MKNKLKKTGAALAILLLALAALIYMAHVRSKSPVEEYKKQLIAAGEKLSIEQLVPPRVPAEQNSADTLRAAVDELKRFTGDALDKDPPSAMRMVIPGGALITWQQPDVRDSMQTNSWAEIEFEVAERQKAFDLLEQIIEKPEFDFELRYDQFPNLPLTHLASMRSAAQKLAAAALANLHRSDTESAVKDVRAMIALLKGTAKEPFLITQLVRINIAQITFSTTWELLQSPGLTDEQLAALQLDWAELDFVHSMESALTMERVWSEKVLEKWRASGGPEALAFENPSGSSSGGSGGWLGGLNEAWRETRIRTKKTIWKISWSYTDELRMLQGDQVLIDTVRQIETNGFFCEALNKEKKTLSDLGFDDLNADVIDAIFGKDIAGEGFRWLLSGDVDMLVKSLERVLAVETAKQMAITGIALKRHQLRNGNYPQSLSVLVPQFLPAVPNDPVDGKPLRYQQTGKTFLLYSIGDNFVDDGGNANSTNDVGRVHWERGLDWVWPQPASLKDVQDYYATNASLSGA